MNRKTYETYPQITPIDEDFNLTEFSYIRIEKQYTEINNG